MENLDLSSNIWVIGFICAISLVFLVCFYFMRRCALRRSGGGDGDDDGDGDGVPVPVPVATGGGGLDPEALNSIPVVVNSTGAGEEECAVCISSFNEGEKLHILPPCGHRFHIECIKKWLQSRATCPLCRSAVEPEVPVADGSVLAETSPCGAAEHRIDIPE